MKTLDNEELIWYNESDETSKEEKKEDENTMWRESLTNHGYERMQQRTKLRDSKAEERVKKVWERGKRIEDFNGSHKFQAYLKNVRDCRGSDRDVRVFGNEVYVFSKEGVCLTVLQIPAKVLLEKNKKKR